MESVIDGEGPLFAEMRCDLSVVRKNLEAGTGGWFGGRAELSVSLHTDQQCQCYIAMIHHSCCQQSSAARE